MAGIVKTKRESKETDSKDGGLKKVETAEKQGVDLMNKKGRKKGKGPKETKRRNMIKGKRDQNTKGIIKKEEIGRKTS